jgi:hypothetical protein
MEGHVYDKETETCSCGEYLERGYNRASRDRNWQAHLSKAKAQIALDAPTLEEQVRQLTERLDALQEAFDKLKSDYDYEHLTREW